MTRSPSPKWWWAIWMTLGGLAVATVVFLLTSSMWWAVFGLVGAGVVFNAVAGPRGPAGRMPPTRPTSS